MHIHIHICINTGKVSKILTIGGKKKKRKGESSVFYDDVVVELFGEFLDEVDEIRVVGDETSYAMEFVLYLRELFLHALHGLLGILCWEHLR